MNQMTKLYKRILRDWPHLFTMWASVEVILKFKQQTSPDFMGFVTAVGGMVLVLTGKHYWDTKADKIGDANAGNSGS